MQDLFKGLSRDELWPELDLNAPGQLSEAQQAMRRSSINIPAFQFDGEFDPDVETSPAFPTTSPVPQELDPLPPEPKPENAAPDRTSFLGPILALILVAAGAAGGAVITWLLMSR